MNRANFRPGPLADVSAHSDGDGWTLVFVRELAHPPARVWSALTEPDQLGEWAPYTASRDLSTTGEATLTMIDRDVREELPSAVTRSEPPRLLEYTWSGAVLRWELAPTEVGTRLTLHHTVDSPDWLPRAAAGWHLCLDVAGHLLAGDPVGPIRGMEAMDFGWNELNHAYADALGVEATDLPNGTSGA